MVGWNAKGRGGRWDELKGTPGILAFQPIQCLRIFS